LNLVLVETTSREKLGHVSLAGVEPALGFGAVKLKKKKLEGQNYKFFKK
jgi:hypothetical protein